MYGKDFGYANSRVAGTLVRLKKNNEPVLVQIVGNSGICIVTPAEDIETREKDLRVHLDDLNLEPVPLGYVNNSGYAIYLQRIPVRRGPGNQGLTQANCGSSGERLWRFPAKSLRQCILGEYPTFAKAVEEAKVPRRNGSRKLIAFNRHWAISQDELYYKNTLLVGNIVKGKPILNPKFNYLKEYLAELV